MGIVCDLVKNIGVTDYSINKFENQYDVPDGVTYNSYFINDSKVTIIDTVDYSKKEEWFAKLESELNGRNPEYLVCLHVEPDHAGCVRDFTQRYSTVKVVGNIKTFVMLEQFGVELSEDRKYIVKDGDVVQLGKTSLKFYNAPLVHWPEVMVAYCEYNGILFSADAFGEFGITSDKDWVDEARRYYFNIVGKYGKPVQMLLAKLKELGINIICPAHGRVLSQHIKVNIDKYDTWSRYESEQDGVCIVVSSLHGNTLEAAKLLRDSLEKKGVPYAIHDLTVEEKSYAISSAFRYNKMVLASSTYDSTIMPVMDSFINCLINKSYQNKTVAYIENGSWAPMANRVMKKRINECSKIEEINLEITIKGAMNDTVRGELEKLAELLK